MNQDKQKCKTKINDLMILDDTQVLGEGAYSKVYRVQLKSDLKKYFAMKTIDLNTISKQNAIFLLKEMQLHKNIKHPHIIQYQGSFQEGSKLYYILDYAENSSLFYYIDLKDGLPEELALRFIYQVGLAIQYLHQQQIVHRDIKPENVLFDKDFNVKLCDFGWSCFLSKNKERNTICGTYEYMSPEIAYEFNHNQKVDIWSMGILLYEMLHGVPPFKAKTIEEIKQELLDQNIVLNANLSNEIIQLVKILLKVDATQRPDINEVLSLPIFRKNLQNFDKKLTTDQLILLATNYMFNSNMGKDKILPKVVQEYYFNTDTQNSSLQYISDTSDINTTFMQSKAITTNSKKNRPVQRLSTTKLEDQVDQQSIINQNKMSPITNQDTLTDSSSSNNNQENQKQEKKSNDTEKIVLGPNQNDIVIKEYHNKKKQKFNCEFSRLKNNQKKYKFQTDQNPHHFMQYKSQLKPKALQLNRLNLNQMQQKETMPRFLKSNNHLKLHHDFHHIRTGSNINIRHSQPNHIFQTQIQTQKSNRFINRSLAQNTNHSTGNLLQNNLGNSQVNQPRTSRVVYARSSRQITSQQLDNRLNKVFDTHQNSTTNNIQTRFLNKNSSLDTIDKYQQKFLNNIDISIQLQLLETTIALRKPVTKINLQKILTWFRTTSIVQVLE